ncbi:RraA family protein [Flavihumibacter profundi]|jgi:4-hydroxy-4-methyl-2-oxoglutarate aldolase|uniref:RraA family protein n=1 Tax=Flavihumibacter profundi TaxID=2716883 RepID=UPI001CC57A20|nr:RraA family protein [Flavihumibacter profundi]MBZ5859559.1 RraA family protein [Flavihumibacter profundi]
MNNRITGLPLMLCIIASIAFYLQSSGQQIQATKDQILTYSSQWKGERYPDGRPKVSDDLVKRLANISMEEAWGVLRNEGFNNQFEAGWQVIHPEKPLAGRVVTAQYMPTRPDVDNPIKAKGKSEGRSGAPNSWPIDLLQNGDVYVADGFSKIIDGTLIGDNLGNSIYTKSKTGVVFDAGVRDLEGLEEIDGFVGFVRGVDPSYIKDVMLTGINYPIRIGRATVLPGDLVLGKKEGVIFIPAYLAEKVIITAEFIAMKDDFSHQRLKEGKYTPGQIDQGWTEDIKKDFMQWIRDNPSKVPMSKAELDAFLKDRTW